MLARWLLLAAIAGSAGSAAAGVQQCCAAGEAVSVVRRGCNSTGAAQFALRCPPGHMFMLLRDPVLNGSRLSTLDSPEFVFADDTSMFCMGEVASRASGGPPARVAVVCHATGAQDAADDYIETTGVLTLVSSAFLFATFAVYMSFPQLRDLQGLCYLCLCISMALGFLWLGVLQLSPGFQSAVCAATGFLVYFWMMATFFWMNVISIHVYRTTALTSGARAGSDSGGRGDRGDRGDRRRQFAWYSAYAWGGSAALLLAALAAELVDGDHWRPGIGRTACWFAGRTETWIFFYGPIAALLAANVLLFVGASCVLWRAGSRRYELGRLDNLKYRFLLSLKLFLVMGISWVFEIASFAHGESHVIWKITDTVNCLQGLVIFVLLVCVRRRVLLALADTRLCWCACVRRLAASLSPHDADLAPLAPHSDPAPQVPLSESQLPEDGLTAI